MKKYIHYGNTFFDRNCFMTVKNSRCGSSKPNGGFWASPVDATWGWKDWCDENYFRKCTEDNSFQFHLAPTANVLVIDNISCLEGLPRAEYGEFSHDLWVSLDFEKLRDSGIDAIEYDLSADGRLYMALYGWDCDSILIMNPDVVVVEET